MSLALYTGADTWVRPYVSPFPEKKAPLDEWGLCYGLFLVLLSAKSECSRCSYCQCEERYSHALVAGLRS